MTNFGTNMGKDLNLKGTSTRLHMKIAIPRYPINFRKLTRTKLFYSHKDLLARKDVHQVGKYCKN